ncbi:hypothetical protein PROFUN_09794 [Planoprotostelium fungivorum]|uniref:Protein kinase domain-containing protein n=1 Tax=Planoprotostelium fungivorum TaxID=1890364 RepID=A0A2P6NGN1_9EUKA|nr:hypothetical protein PROFUN_09794 [Planoprotostelium fungivorum]
MHKRTYALCGGLAFVGNAKTTPRIETCKRIEGAPIVESDGRLMHLKPHILDTTIESEGPISFYEESSLDIALDTSVDESEEEISLDTSFTDTTSAFEDSFTEEEIKDTPNRSIIKPKLFVDGKSPFRTPISRPKATPSPLSRLLSPFKGLTPIRKTTKNMRRTSISEWTKTPSKLGVNGQDAISGGRYVPTIDVDMKSGKHGSVFFVETPTNKSKYAVKMQEVAKPGNRDERAYRELSILQELSTLDCDGFVGINDWWKIRDEKPEKRRGKENGDPQQMYIVMQRGDASWSDLKNTFTTNQIRDLLFQLLFSLDLAQEKYKFSHNDLHAGNILIRSTDRVQKYKKGKEEWRTNGPTAIICDFGLGYLERKKQTPGGEVTERIGRPPAHMQGDVDSLRHIFCTTKPVDAKDQTAETKKLIKSLREKLGSELPPPPGELLKHPYFEPLKFISEFAIKRKPSTLQRSRDQWKGCSEHPRQRKVAAIKDFSCNLASRQQHKHRLQTVIER